MKNNKLYSLTSSEKNTEILADLNLRLRSHYYNSLEYRRIIDGIFENTLPSKKLEPKSAIRWAAAAGIKNIHTIFEDFLPKNKSSSYKWPILVEARRRMQENLDEDYNKALDALVEFAKNNKLEHGRGYDVDVMRNLYTKKAYDHNKRFIK